eukprot:Ihof_evm11s100 gene=Ihof_evmTU11s100
MNKLDVDMAPAIVSRQFVEMSRSRIEGLYAAFPKLQNTGKQHTFVETENVRYVYQPVEKVYVVLITNKNSNILEDLETLHLFARVIPEYCRTLDEIEISNKAFDLLFAFDEIVALGYRESVSLAQIRTFTDMDSHEEKMFQMVQKNKEKEAKEEMKRKMKELERQRREQGGNRRAPATSTGFGSGFGSGNAGSGSMSGVSSYGGATSQGGNDFNDSGSYGSSEPRSIPSSTAGKGLKLGGKKKMDEFVSALAHEGQRITETPVAYSQNAPNAPVLVDKAQTESIHIRMEEKITLTALRDGGLQSMEVKGDLIVNVSDPEKARLRVNVQLPEDKPFQYKTHPNCNKQLFSDECGIALKDPVRPFPLNADQGVLKYRLATTDDSLIPLSVNCWPSMNPDGTCDVNIEYELEETRLSLEQITISIPVPTGAPKVGNYDNEYFYNTRDRSLEWTIPVIDANSPTGSMEFTATVADVNAFFPVTVVFVSSTSFSDLQ